MFIEDWLEVISTEEGQFSLKLVQNPLYTKEVLVDLRVEIMLVDYPQSQPALIPITVSKKQCVPTDFAYSKVTDQEIVVGDEPKTIEIQLNQEPCNFEIQ